MKTFYQWLMEDMRPAGKFGIYPPSWGGTGLYAPADWMPGAADAITYMDKKWGKFKFLDTFHPPKNANQQFPGRGLPSAKMPPI